MKLAPDLDISLWTLDIDNQIVWLTDTDRPDTTTEPDISSPTNSLITSPCILLSEKLHLLPWLPWSVHHNPDAPGLPAWHTGLGYWRGIDMQPPGRWAIYRLTCWRIQRRTSGRQKGKNCHSFFTIQEMTRVNFEEVIDNCLKNWHFDFVFILMSTTICGFLCS